MRNQKKPKKHMLGFYKRKLVFFLVFFLLVGVGIKIVGSGSLSADTDGFDNYTPSGSQDIAVVVLKNGDITIDGKKIRHKVDLLGDFDEVRLPIMDNSGQYYSNVRITLELPETINSAVKYEFLAIHGVGSSTVMKISDRQLLYNASNVSSQATLTIVAKMPKGIISPPIARVIMKDLSQIKGSIWLIVAAVLPFLTFLLMLAFISNQIRQQKIDKPDKETSSPPMAIPPSIVGALYKQKVGPREIAATLIDLALRGDILIVDRERGFEFGKNKFDQRLLPFEKILLSKIFKKNIYSDQSDIEERVNNHFYSKKISLVSSGVYTLATRLGYFKINPQSLHAKYRLVGIFSFLLAVGGFVASLVWFTDPPYAIFFWVGMMISALIISILAGRMPVRTVIGREVLSNWFAFKKFLSNHEQFPYAENNQDIFQKFLPYAIVLECEAAWAKRFSKHNFITPEWFLTEKTGLGLEDFCLSLFPIVSYVGRSLAALKEPGFE